jgi:hypothetical protein
MTLAVPTTEPLSARAGETWRWSRSFSDFPAPTWELTYTLFSAAGVIAITADADGASHLVDLAPATTAAYVAGRYRWNAQVTDGTDVHTVGSGVLSVLPDLSEETTYDGRSHARIMLDAIEAMMEGRATDGDIDVVKTVVGQGRATDYDLPSLMKLRQQYAAAVAAEDDAERIAAGGKSNRLVQVRFR